MHVFWKNVRSIIDYRKISLKMLASAEQAQGERRALEAERAESLAATARAREEIDRAAGELVRLTDAAHRDEVARAEQRTRLEALSERAMSELGMEIGPLVEEYGPHVPVPEVVGAGDPDGGPGDGGGRQIGRASCRERV